MTLMGTLVTYNARVGKEPRDGIVVKHLPTKNKTELIDCVSRRHAVVSQSIYCVDLMLEI